MPIDRDDDEVMQEEDRSNAIEKKHTMEPEGNEQEGDDRPKRRKIQVADDAVANEQGSVGTTIRDTSSQETQSSTATGGDRVLPLAPEPETNSVSLPAAAAPNQDTLPAPPKIQRSSSHLKFSVDGRTTAETNSSLSRAPSVGSNAPTDPTHSAHDRTPMAAMEPSTLASTPSVAPEKRCIPMLLSLLVVLLAFAVTATFRPPATRQAPRHYDHIIPPAHYYSKDGDELASMTLANFTLRDILHHPDGFHLAMAPSFFGFYGYFGMLAAWEDHVSDTMLRNASHLRSVAGASAGAMAAVLLAAGVRPKVAAEFCGTMTLPQFADPPGVVAAFKGDVFEQIMHEFLQQESPEHSLRLEDGNIPVAVSGFDLRTMSGKILRKGSMARAARASATFPLLFQPVRWEDEESESSYYLLIDGGLTDSAGLNGVQGVKAHQFVVNLVVGAPWEIPLLQQTTNHGARHLTVSMRNLPVCGPWAMANGPIAVETATRAMAQSLDVPLYLGKDPNHFELHIDASKFWSS